MVWRKKRRHPGAKHVKRHDSPRIEELEPRLLFSADAAGVFSPDIYNPLQPATDILVDEYLEPITPNSNQAVHDEQRLELVFVDTDTPDYQQLVDDLLTERDDGRLIEVIVLDNTRDNTGKPYSRSCSVSRTEPSVTIPAALRCMRRKNLMSPPMDSHGPTADATRTSVGPHSSNA